MSGERSRPISATELLRQLNADPDFVAARERLEVDMANRRAEHAAAERPLIAELHDAGLNVDSVWDLVNTSDPYPAALPIVLRHLSRPYPDSMREGMARALAVRAARPFWAELVNLYVKEPADTHAKDGLAVALAAIADEELVDQIIELARDSDHGDSRLFFMRALRRSAMPALDEFVDDPVLGEEARALRGGRHG